MRRATRPGAGTPSWRPRCPARRWLCPRSWPPTAAPSKQFWRSSVLDPPTDGAGARARFADAIARFEAVMRPHTLAAMLAQAVYEQASKLATAAGLPGLETRLMTGYGGFEETAADAGAVGRLPWPARPSTTSSPPTATTARPRARSPPVRGGRTGRRWPNCSRPTGAWTSRRGRRPSRPPGPGSAKTATAALLAALPAVKRPAARFVLGASPALHPVAGGRQDRLPADGRHRPGGRPHVGEDLARRGVVGDPEDVFYLTVAEVLDPRCPTASRTPWPCAGNGATST